MITKKIGIKFGNIHNVAQMTVEFYQLRSRYFFLDMSLTPYPYKYLQLILSWLVMIFDLVYVSITYIVKGDHPTGKYFYQHFHTMMESISMSELEHSKKRKIFIMLYL